MLGQSRVRVAAVALVALFGATGASFGYAAQASSGRVVMAEFTDVSPIVPGQQVKVHGVTVGQVGEPSFDAERGLALVPLYVDASAMPVHDDASASVAPVSLLGERYIDLHTGSPDAPELGLMDAIPATATSQDEDLQAVLDTLDDPTAASLAALVGTLGQGFDNNGEEVQAAITALEPAMTDTDALVRVLAEQNELLGSVVDRVEPVASAVAADGGARLDGLVASATDLLATTAERDAALQGTLAELPGTLTEARTTLDDLSGTATTTAATLQGIRPVTDDLRELSLELQAFADSADPALSSLDGVLERADELLTEARPIAAELRAAGPDLASTLDGLQPVVGDLTGNLGDVFAFIRNWALTTNQRDGLSHYFRAFYVLNPDAVSGYLPGGLADLAPSPGPDATPDDQIDSPAGAGGPTGRLPGAEGRPGDLGLLGGGGDSSPRGDGDPPGGNRDGASGLTEEQERGAVGMLLGGN